MKHQLIMAPTQAVARDSAAMSCLDTLKLGIKISSCNSNIYFAAEILKLH